MEKINIWDTKLKDKFTYYSNIDDILDFISKNKSTTFYVIDENGLDNGESTTMYVSAINESAEKNGKEVTYLDSDHRAFINQFNDIYFSREFSLWLRLDALLVSEAITGTIAAVNKRAKIKT